MQKREKLLKKKLEVLNKLYTGEVILNKDIENLLENSSLRKRRRMK
jgi:hypothetical protein